MATAAELLRASGLDAREARLLLANRLGVSLAVLGAYPERTIEPQTQRRIETDFARRRAGEPVAYIMGEREFYGLLLRVNPAVLIPRPETELIVELALARLCDGDRVLDLGTGSGAIAIALAVSRPALEVSACDVSESVLALARSNAARHGARLRLVASDWFSALSGEQFNAIVSNPPYIASGDRHLTEGDLRWEPRHALEAGPSGMEAITAIVLAAPKHLLPEGWLAIEHGYDQGPACEALLRRAGFADVADHADLAGLPRVAIGRWKRSSAMLKS